MLKNILENSKVLSKNEQQWINGGGVCHKPIVDPCAPPEEWSNRYCQCIPWRDGF